MRLKRIYPISLHEKGTGWCSELYPCLCSKALDRNRSYSEEQFTYCDACWSDLMSNSSKFLEEQEVCIPLRQYFISITSFNDTFSHGFMTVSLSPFTLTNSE